MKVKTLIEKLEKMDPEAEVRLHDKCISFQTRWVFRKRNLIRRQKMTTRGLSLMNLILRTPRKLRRLTSPRKK